MNSDGHFYVGVLCAGVPGPPAFVGVRFGVIGLPTGGGKFGLEVLPGGGGGRIPAGANFGKLIYPGGGGGGGRAPFEFQLLIAGGQFKFQLLIAGGHDHPKDVPDPDHELHELLVRTNCP